MSSSLTALFNLALLAVQLAAAFMCLWNAPKARALERLGLGFGAMAVGSLLSLAQNLWIVSHGVDGVVRSLGALSFLHIVLTIVAWGFLLAGVSRLISDLRPQPLA